MMEPIRRAVTSTRYFACRRRTAGLILLEITMFDARESEWLDAALRIRPWEQQGLRAPHKPLLLLFALGRLQRSGQSNMAFGDAEEPLRRLLREYGRPGIRLRAEYPFYHLQNDNIWQITPRIAVPAGSSATRRQLLEAGVMGRLVPNFEAALKADPQFLAAVARSVLDRNFPPSLHDEICSAVGLDLQVPETGRSKERTARDPSFRWAVLLAYEYRCAICGYQGQLAGQFTGLDAAHVHWRALGGPDSVDNGLCLCSLHHKLFDSGVLSIGDDYRVLVSSHFIGHNDAAQEFVTRRAGAQLLPPQPGQSPVAGEHLAWHRAQVFRGPARLGP